MNIHGQALYMPAAEAVKYPHTTFRIDGTQFDAMLFQSCEDALFSEIEGSSIFLTKNYHRALSEAPPDKMDFRYVRLEQSGRLIGMLCFQIKSFNPGESLKKHAGKNLVNKIRYKLASLINMSVLCLGNTLVTGDYGFSFDEHVPKKLQTLLMMETIDWLLSRKEYGKIRLVFVKDFYEDIFSEIPGSPFCKKYHPIDTQPSMILDIPEHWKGITGYLADLKSKYRVRAKKAIQLSSALVKSEASLEEIQSLEEVLHALYLKVVEDVGFNLFILNKHYFTSLKQYLGDRFRLWLYKKDGEVIGFYTVFEDDDILDAHFLGYDPQINHEYKLYLDMLLSMIDHASSRGFRQLQLSRTATEIKSSVGADGIRMWAYMRHPKRSLNGLIPWLYSFFKPDLSWTPREPFHEG